MDDKQETCCDANFLLTWKATDGIRGISARNKKVLFSFSKEKKNRIRRKKIKHEERKKIKTWRKKENKNMKKERKWKHEERKKTVLVSHHSFIMRLSSFDFSQISIMFCLLFFSLFSLGSIDPTVQEMSYHHCTGNKVTWSYNMLLFFQKKKKRRKPFNGLSIFHSAIIELWLFTSEHHVLFVCLYFLLLTIIKSQSWIIAEWKIDSPLTGFLSFFFLLQLLRFSRALQTSHVHP